MIYKTSIFCLLLSSCSFFSKENKPITVKIEKLDTITNGIEHENPKKVTKLEFKSLSSAFRENFEPTAKQIRKLITYTNSLNIKNNISIDKQATRILEILSELSNEHSNVEALKDNAVRSRMKGIETYAQLTLYTIQNNPKDSIFLQKGIEQVTLQTKYFIEQINEAEHKYQEGGTEEFSL